MEHPAFVAPGTAQRLAVNRHMACTALPKRVSPQNPRQGVRIQRSEKIGARWQFPSLSFRCKVQGTGYVILE